MAKKVKLTVTFTDTPPPGIAPAWLPEIYRPVLEELTKEFPFLAMSTSDAKFKVAEAVATKRWGTPVYPGIAIAPTGRVIARASRRSRSHCVSIMATSTVVGTTSSSRPRYRSAPRGRPVPTVSG